MVTEPEKQAKPTLILVIGMNRSGTKWLSNILSKHPEIAGVQSDRHTGIVETNRFGCLFSIFIRDLCRVGRRTAAS